MTRHGGILARSSAVVLVLAVAMTGSCARKPDPAARRSDAEAELRGIIEASGAEVVGLYYRSLGDAADSITIDADVRMHAASTMKVPVMMQLFLDAQSGLRPLDSRLAVTRTFRSIVDGSAFELPMDSDSDTTFYGRVGEEVTIEDLVEHMITWSSNLSTNILIEVAQPDRIAATMHEIGADSMQVLRGVEDLKAFEAGLSNTTTARALGTVMASVASSELFTPESRDAMVDILSHQHFVEGIPSGLPAGTRVANKTGWITGIQHDAAIVYPEGESPYVLVVMVRGHPAEDQGQAMTAELSRVIWAYHTGQ